MTKTQKTLLGIASFVPIAVGIACFVLYVSIFRDILLQESLQHNPQLLLPELLDRMRLVFLLVLPGGCIHVTLLILFILHAVRNRSLESAERVIWIVSFVLFGAIAYPLYFFLRIFNTDIGQVAVRARA